MRAVIYLIKAYIPDKKNEWAVYIFNADNKKIQTVIFKE